jgi:hypothetical protein
MGQAKARREALRRKLLEKGKEWDFPPSPWEAAVCAELRKQTVVIVPRAPAEQLAWARMPANECHANVRWYAKNDPSGRARAITGWWVQWPNFVLHSVVEMDSKLICITPTPLKETEIPFIPDPQISWIEGNDVYSAIRNGEVVGPGVRVFPAFTMAQSAIVRQRMDQGVDPFKATEFTNEEMEELKRQYIGVSTTPS